MPAAWAAGIAAVAGIAGSAISAGAQADAASTAANEQYQAAQLSAQTQRYFYDQTRSDLSPYLKTGQGALSQLAGLYGVGTGGPSAATARKATSALTQYPGYQFQFGQGVQALDRSAASRGLLLSGGQLKDAQAYGQGLAQSTAWQPYVSELGSLASLGENAGALTGNAGTAAGQGIASSQLAGGQALAAGTVGGANALTSGLQGGLNSALLGYSLYQNGQYSDAVNNNAGIQGFNYDFGTPLTSQPITQAGGY